METVDYVILLVAFIGGLFFLSFFIRSFMQIMAVMIFIGVLALAYLNLEPIKIFLAGQGIITYEAAGMENIQPLGNGSVAEQQTANNEDGDGGTTETQTP